jgi:F-box/leucine-rich repeat protein 10/11
LDVQEIRALVGSRRYLEVMDVTSQKNIQMTMKEFNKYEL